MGGLRVKLKNLNYILKTTVNFKKPYAVSTMTNAIGSLKDESEVGDQLKVIRAT